MPQVEQQSSNDQRNRDTTGAADAAVRGAQATPVAPQPPGGGTLSNTLFSGDHVLETIAAGTGLLRSGGKGPAVRAVQNYLINLGYTLGRSGADGDFGNATLIAVRAYQKANGLGADGIIGKGTLGHMDKGGAVGPINQTPQPTSGDEPGAPMLTDFDEMWAAHPHNYQEDSSQNYASDDLQRDQGWDPDQYGNTCAIRLSVMMNTLGGNHTLTRDKAEKAGIKRNRLPYSRKTGWYYILSAREMWTYMEYWAGSADVEFPSRTRFKNADEFQAEFDSKIKTVLSGKRGFVAFDKIFGYSGTGHVDIFDGEKLSDATNWYPCRRLKLWFVG